MTPAEVEATRRQIFEEARDVIRQAVGARTAGDRALADALLSAGTRLMQLADYPMLAFYLDDVLEEAPRRTG